MDRLLLGQVCGGQIVTGAGLLWTDCYWGRCLSELLNFTSNYYSSNAVNLCTDHSPALYNLNKLQCR